MIRAPSILRDCRNLVSVGGTRLLADLQSFACSCCFLVRIVWECYPIMEHLVDKEMENEMDTGAIAGCIAYLWSVGNEGTTKTREATIFLRITQWVY